MRKLFIAVCLLLTVGLARAEEIRIGTYNIEHWAERFDARELAEWARTLPASDRLNSVVRTERNQDDKDNWMIASVIQSPEFNPDILLIQEGCNQANLEAFNKKWLKGAYETLIVLPSNSGREQHIAILLKPGFKVLDKRDQYYLEKDSVEKSFLQGNDSPAAVENRLFARGPGFVLVESPSGYKFWVGTNHQKSKSGNNVDVTRWRNREAARIHQILKEIEQIGPADVIFGGDMNDEIGYQEFELEAGGDSIALIIGPPEAGITCVTKPLAERGAISYGGYYNDRYRSFIDHMFVTRSLKDRVAGVSVITGGLAPAASDHYPVLVRIRTPEK